MIELVYYYTMNARTIDKSLTNWSFTRFAADNIRSKFKGNIARKIS